uniref:Uncharacterized protein n=2 Tax=Anguilla anguilla TaxID=7936 RepID=A0A0E9SD70_ANGAN
MLSTDTLLLQWSMERNRKCGYAFIVRCSFVEETLEKPLVFKLRC